MLDQLAGVKVLQIQPVEPRKLTSEEIGERFGYSMLGIAILLPGLSLLLWIALGTIHDLWPALLAVGPSYGQAMTLLVDQFEGRVEVASVLPVWRRYDRCPTCRRVAGERCRDTRCSELVLLETPHPARQLFEQRAA